MTRAKIAWVALLSGAVCLAAAAGGPAETINAQQAFERLKSLAGTWKGSTSQGHKATVTYEVVADGSAVLERLERDVPAEGPMITLYYLDGDRLQLTHYCVAQNQPRMEAESYSPADGVLRFRFLSASNLPNLDAGHMYKVVYRFRDADHLSAAWTFREKQEDRFTAVVDLTRTR